MYDTRCTYFPSRKEKVLYGFGSKFINRFSFFSFSLPSYIPAKSCYANHC